MCVSFDLGQILEQTGEQESEQVVVWPGLAFERFYIPRLALNQCKTVSLSVQLAKDG